MARGHLVVDGSNIATEGRTAPSLKQLDEAVRAFLEQNPFDSVTVVVDATFPNRIDPSERATFEDAIVAGELITPPAGAIGRGDGFILQIADRANAVILSNDSFQEFHPDYPWLFDKGRLLGGKPVPGVGWVFMERAPVRGPTSRRATADARRKTTKAASGPASAKPTPAKRSRKQTSPENTSPKQPRRAPAGAAAMTSGEGSRRRRTSEKPAEQYNAPLPFIEFVAAHPVGSLVEGTVDRFSSHGAYITADGALCYLPLKNMGNPPPRSARELLSSGESREFVVQAFDTPRRGVDLALQGVAAPAAAEDPVPNQPQEERVMAVKKAAKKSAKKTTARKSAKKAPARKTAAKKTTKRAPAKKTAKKSAAKKTAKRPAKKTAAKKAVKKAVKKTAKKRATAKKAPARKTAAKKTAKKRAPARKAAKRTAKKR
jgi:hypothetical protein